eukprot:CCRYP_001124-RA/>CCRYP_001124-RA protein AED:0.02 eAED:0.02 QI:258/1/1/1/1/1/3/113/1121
MMFRSTMVVRVPHPATTLLSLGRSDHYSTVHQFTSKGFKTAFRHNSFKAFAQRNENNAMKSKPESAVGISAENDVKSATKGTTTSSNNGGAFSEMIKRNEANKSSQGHARNRPASRHNDDKGDNAVFASRNNARTQRSSNYRPWERERNQNNEVDPNKKWNRNNWKSNSAASFGDRGDRKNEGYAASTFHPMKASEDLKDISALRNAFMPHKPANEKPREPWRASPSSYQDKNFESKASIIGKKFTPSWYTPKKPDAISLGSDGNSSVVSKIDGNQSLEQVLRNNANQRKQDMAQRYLNAGEAVPFNIDEYGNPASGSPTNYTWRQPGRNTNEHGRGMRGGALQRNSYQRHTKNQYQQRDPRMGQGQTGRTPQQRQAFQRGGPWAKKKRRQALPSSAPKEVRLPLTPLTLVDLSLLLRVRKRTIVRTLRSLGEPISYQSANQDSFKIDPEMMEYICVDLGIEPLKTEQRVSSVVEAERRALRQLSEEMDEEQRTEEEEKYAALPPRAPVVCIMGHVDHGKTTLMDALRRRAVTMNTSGGSNSKKASKKKSKESKSRGGKGVSLDSDNVAGTEAGGITQVITAFEVPLSLDESSGDKDGAHNPISTVTFLDTPGHAAFKKMRQSGSSATDVIVLVVAADDGVSPQTIEIIDMFKTIARSQPQSISLVIAVSKIDKPGIDVDEAVMRIENQLMEHEIFTENVLAGGGDEGEFGACQLFPVSGLTGEGLDDLVEGLALQSELMDLRADYDARGEGIVIDARMEKGLGVVADCVMRWGKVEPGDFVVSGTHGGKVRFLNDVANKPLKRAKPSQPVRIVGFKSLPKAGDPIVIAASEEEAKELIRVRESELHNEDRAEFDADVELQVMGTAAKQGSMMQKAQQRYGFDGDDEKDEDEIIIPVVIKADSHGALEAVRDALLNIGSDSKLNVVIDPVEMSTGVITTSDVVMARESNAAIFVFGNVGIADKETKTLAENAQVSIRNHEIIYRLLEDAKEYFVKYLPTEDEVVVHGKATVQAVFEVTDDNKKSVSIAGLRVTDGNLFKQKSKAGGEGGVSSLCFYRVIRNGKVIVSEDEKLKATSLRKVKENVESVRRGDECGLGLDGYNDIAEGDVVECYSIEEKRASL